MDGFFFVSLQKLVGEDCKRKGVAAPFHPAAPLSKHADGLFRAARPCFRLNKLVLSRFRGKCLAHITALSVAESYLMCRVHVWEYTTRRDRNNVSPLRQRCKMLPDYKQFYLLMKSSSCFDDCYSGLRSRSLVNIVWTEPKILNVRNSYSSKTNMQTI